MSEWIITSSILILIIIAVRYTLKGKISLRLQYALWALVLVRLLIPFSIGSSSISVLNFAGETVEGAPWQDAGNSVTSEQATDEMSTYAYGQGSVDSVAQTDVTVNTGAVKVPVTSSAAKPVSGTNHEVISRPTYEVETSVGIVEIESTVNAGNITDESIVNTDGTESDIEPVDIVAIVSKTAMIIWIAGMIIVGGYFVIVNAGFSMALEKDRQLLEKEDGYPLPVYFTGSVDTPCMHGLINPKIYVTSEATANEQVLRHVLEHETTHYRHGDHIWCVLRAVALAIHWYNPLVWFAAVLSRNDSELACDEGTIKRIGEEERTEYGRTLIDLTCQRGSGLFVAATMMTGSKKSIKERIVLIAKKPKMALYTLIAVVVIVAAAVGCTFTGADNGDSTEQSSSNKNGDGDEQPTTPADEQPTTSGSEQPTTSGEETTTGIAAGGDLYYKWRLEGDTLTFSGSGAINKGDWRDEEFKHVVIRNGIDSIEEGAFSDCKSLESVEMPDSISAIEAYTFDGCERLESITFPKKLTSCGEYAFRDTLWFKNKLEKSKAVSASNVLIDATNAVGNVNVSNSITVIADYAFYDNCNIVSMSLPETLESIGEKAFCGCEKLEEIQYHELTDINLAAGIFEGTAWLEKQRGEDSLVIISGILVDGSKASGKVIIPEDVHTICGNAFYNADSIEEVIIPENVDTIGDRAFYDCDALTSVTINNRYIWIKEDILGECDNLKFIRCNGTSNAKVYANKAGIPYELIITYDWRMEGDTLIFSGKNIVEAGEWINEDFKHVVMEVGITEISSSAIDYLKKTESIVFPSTYKEISGFYGFPNLKEVVMEEGVELIIESAFAECRTLERVVIPESVTEIMYWAFEGCTSLKEIVLPEMITDIGIEAFIGTPWLESLKADSPFAIVNGVLLGVNKELAVGDIVIPDGVTAIVTSDFYVNDKITGVTIPESVTFIYGNTFANLPNLEVIYGKTGSYAEEYAKRIGVAFEEMKDYTWRIEGDTIIFSGTGTVEKSGWEDESFTKVVFEDGIKSIGNFESLTNIESVVLGKGITYVGEWAFAGCTNLKEIVFTDTPVTFGYDALIDVPWLKEMRKENPLVIVNGVLIDAAKAEGDIVVPEGVTIIGDFALANDVVTSVVFPTTLEYVGWRAFYGNDKLTKVTFRGGSNYSIERDAFVGCNSLKEISFGKGLTSIGVEAFLDCTSLTKVVLPDGCTDIWERAFESCTNLKEIVIPDSVTNIGSHAFIETAWLADRQAENSLVVVNGVLVDGSMATGKVVIPEGVTAIAESVFYEAENIVEIVIPEGVTTLGNLMAYHLGNLQKITIPASVTTIKCEDFLYSKHCLEIIYGVKGSYAESYAKEIGVAFEAIK